MSIVLDGSNGITTNSGTVVSTTDATLNGLTVGKGGGSVSTNTAVGASALAVNTSGSNNVAVGNGASASNTTGSQITAIGKNTLYTNTTGNYNIGMGENALYYNTTGSNNVGIGPSALQSNTTASNNTAVGYQALYTSTTAPNNTAIGHHAGGSLTTGSENTLVGGYTGYSLTTGTKNTFIGAQGSTSACGYEVTTGSKNTILGSFTGNQGGLDIRTSSNNIVLSDGDGNIRWYSNGSYGQSVFNSGYILASGMVSLAFAGNSFQGYVTNDSSSTAGAQHYKFLVNAVEAGKITTSGTSTTYSTSSDYRLKEKIEPMTGALAKVALLKPVTYKWKASEETSQGFIAHELQEVVPECVVGTKDAVDKDGNPEYQGIDTSFLVATLTAAIKELKALVDAQATEIAELKAKVA